MTDLKAENNDEIGHYGQTLNKLTTIIPWLRLVDNDISLPESYLSILLNYSFFDFGCILLILLSV